MQGELQETVEKYLADSIPYRDDVLLSYAAGQRAAIRLANVPFRFAAYPTHYDSSRLVSEETGALYKRPASSSVYKRDMIDAASQRVVQLVEDHRDLSWAFCLGDDTEVSCANPAHTLVSDAVDYDDLLAALKAPLEDAGCKVLDGGYDDEASYLGNFFHTDHHMQIQGGMRVYKDVMAAFGKETVVPDVFEVAYSGGFFGSDARAGLDTDSSDIVWDVVYDPSKLTVNIDGAAKGLDALDSGWREGQKYEKSLRFSNVYGEYFHSDYKVVTIENEDLDESAGSLLLISDSYDNSTSRLYAESYKRVYEVSCKHGIDIDAFIREHGDIVSAAIVLTPQYLSKLLVVS